MSKAGHEAECRGTWSYCSLFFPVSQPAMCFLVQLYFQTQKMNANPESP